MVKFLKCARILLAYVYSRSKGCPPTFAARMLLIWRGSAVRILNGQYAGLLCCLMPEMLLPKLCVWKDDLALAFSWRKVGTPIWGKVRCHVIANYGTWHTLRRRTYFVPRHANYPGWFFCNVCVCWRKEGKGGLPRVATGRWQFDTVTLTLTCHSRPCNWLGCLGQPASQFWPRAKWATLPSVWATSTPDCLVSC